MSALDNIPGLSGYLAAQQQGQAQQMGQIQQVSQLVGLRNAIAQQQQNDATKQLMAQSGGDPEKAMTALLQAGNYKAAAELAPLVKLAQHNKIMQGADLTNAPPEKLEELGTKLSAAGDPYGNTLLAQAERMRKTNAATATLNTMRSAGGVQPDPQEIEQANDQGTPVPQATPQGGLFSTLMQSDNPQIAAQAKALQAQLDKSDPRTIPPSYWQSRQDVLARMQATWDNQKAVRAATDAAKAASKPPVVEMDPEGLKIAAWENLLFGKNPPGMGNASAAQRAQVANERARIAKGLGLSPMETAMLPQDNKVKMKAVDQLTRWGATVGRSAQKLELDMDVALGYAEKMPLGQLQSINRAMLAGRKEFNDPNANAYAAALNSVRQEYARLMSGPTSNAMLPVEAMKKGNELLAGGVNLQALKEVKRQMMMDASNTITATNAQINGLRGSIQGLGKGDYFPPAPGGATAAPNIVEAAKAELARRRANGGK